MDRVILTRICVKIITEGGEKFYPDNLWTVVLDDDRVFRFLYIVTNDVGQKKGRKIRSCIAKRIDGLGRERIFRYDVRKREWVERKSATMERTDENDPIEAERKTLAGRFQEFAKACHDFKTAACEQISKDMADHGRTIGWIVAGYLALVIVAALKGWIRL